MAASHRAGSGVGRSADGGATSSGEPPVAAAAHRSAIGLLNVLLVASVLVPLVLFVTVSWISHRSALADAQQDLLRTSEVAREQAAKVFEGQSQVADRINDLVSGMDVATIRMSEAALHEAFARIVSHLPQVASVMLADRDGHPLVSAGTYPVPNADLRIRDYFQAIVGGFGGTYVSSVQVGDVLRQRFFGLARPWTDFRGTLLGVIDVAVEPAFFEEFYRALIGEGDDGAAGKIVTMLRDDGQILVRYPPFQGVPPRAAPDNPFFAAVNAQPDSGVFEDRSIIDHDAPRRLFAYRKVQGYPIYVIAGRSRSAIIGQWEWTMASHLLFGVPATVALFLITWVALVRTRREADALTRARQEMRRREQAEEALLRAQRLEAVGQMTGGIAHDFNNLMTVVLGGAEMLTKRAEDPARVRRTAEQIVLAVNRGTAITKQLLAFARRDVVNPETVNLNKCLRDFKEMLDRAARDAVGVELDLDPGLDPVQLDPGHFEAAVLNLVGNARDAMPDGGRIVIRTRNVRLNAPECGDLPAGAYVRMDVIDDGIGMNPETAARAFEPFFTTKDVGKGTGLGLSQVYGFTRQVGGDVRIMSAPGQGTTVALLLPRADGRPTEQRPAFDVVPLRRARGDEVILIVEDEPSVLDMATENLTALGYRTIAATTATAALERLKGPERVDVLFSDVMMPGGMNGLRLAAEARRLRPGIKVLLTSGYAGEFEQRPSEELPLLNKPYDQRQLAARIHEVLRN
jgi:two-component system NtrC family sensor kinase